MKVHNALISRREYFFIFRQSKDVDDSLKLRGLLTEAYIIANDVSPKDVFLSFFHFYFHVFASYCAGKPLVFDIVNFLNNKLNPFRQESYGLLLDNGSWLYLSFNIMITCFLEIFHNRNSKRPEWLSFRQLYFL